MNKIHKIIGDIGILPVVTISDSTHAIPLAHALEEGGIPIVEITFRTTEARAAMHLISENCPKIIFGAGTVINVEQAKIAKAAGAAFAVSPGFNPNVVEWCLKNNLQIIPGCMTPSEIERAMEYELSVIKFFPAEQAGGVDFINAVSAPYPTLNFLPTGGISVLNLRKYLALRCVLACGGSWMVRSDLISSGAYETITEYCREAVSIVREMRGE